MAVASWLANQILPATVLLSAVTVGVGLAACPLQSAPFQHAFVYLSLATLVGALAAFIRHRMRPTPFQRGIKIEFALVPFILMWAFLMLPCNHVREASARTMMIINGKQIGLAAHSFHDDNSILPSNLLDPAGMPLLSWRVGVLPYLDAALLHRQFDLTQTWDSAANLPLLEKMPSTYQSLMFEEARGHTPWQGFVGPGTAFEAGMRLNLRRDFPDGTSFTILVIEAKEHVPWSKPADIAYGPNLPLPPLGQPYPRHGDFPFCCYVLGNPAFHACMADCTVRSFAADIPEQTLRALIVRNDGQPADLPD